MKVSNQNPQKFLCIILTRTPELRMPGPYFSLEAAQVDTSNPAVLLSDGLKRGRDDRRGRILAICIRLEPDLLQSLLVFWMEDKISFDQDIAW